MYEFVTVSDKSRASRCMIPIGTVFQIDIVARKIVRTSLGGTVRLREPRTGDQAFPEGC